MDHRLTSEDLIRDAEARGHLISSRQLERWRNWDLIPKGTRVGQGRGSGAAWFYPPEALEQLRTLLAIQRPNERLAEIGVRLWLRGGPIPIERLRRFLAAELGVLRRMRNSVAKQGGVREFAEQKVSQLSRDSKTKKKFGFTRFRNAKEQERAQALFEGLGLLLIAPTRTPPPETVAALGSILPFGSEERGLMEQLGWDQDTEVSRAFWQTATSDTPISDLSDQDLSDARRFWAVFHQLGCAAEHLPEGNPLRSLFQRFPEAFDGAFGFSLIIQVFRSINPSGFSEKMQQLEAILSNLRALA